MTTIIWDTKINQRLIQTYNVMELRRNALCEVENSGSKYVRAVIDFAQREVEQAEKAHEQACTLARRNGYQPEDIAWVLTQYKRSLRRAKPDGS